MMAVEWQQRREECLFDWHNFLFIECFLDRRVDCENPVTRVSLTVNYCIGSRLERVPRIRQTLCCRVDSWTQWVPGAGPVKRSAHSHSPRNTSSESEY